MAITDAKLYFTIDTQTVTTSEVISENVIDFGAANHDAGEGRPTYLNIAVQTGIAGDVCTVRLYSHSTATVTSGKIEMQFDIPISAAGTLVRKTLPPEIAGRYVGLSFDGGASLSAGAVYAWLDLG